MFKVRWLRKFYGINIVWYCGTVPYPILANDWVLTIGWLEITKYRKGSRSEDKTQWPKGWFVK